MFVCDGPDPPSQLTIWQRRDELERADLRQLNAVNVLPRGNNCCGTIYPTTSGTVCRALGSRAARFKLGKLTKSLVMEHRNTPRQMLHDAADHAELGVGLYAGRFLFLGTGQFVAGHMQRSALPSRPHVKILTSPFVRTTRKKNRGHARRLILKSIIELAHRTRHGRVPRARRRIRIVFEIISGAANTRSFAFGGAEMDAAAASGLLTERTASRRRDSLCPSRRAVIGETAPAPPSVSYSTKRGVS